MNMKNILLAILLLIPCRLLAQDDTQIRKDSLRNRIAVTEGSEKLTAYELLTTIYYMEVGDDLKMDTLLALYREYDAEALRQEKYKAQGIIRYNIIGAYCNRQEFDEVFKLAPDYLEYLSKHEAWQAYYAIYMTMLRSYLDIGENDKAIAGAQQMYNEAKQRDHNNGKGMSLYVLSSAYGYMSRFEEEAKYMSECIETIKDEPYILWLTAQAYFKLCSVLITLERYDEASRRLQEFEEINYRYEEASKSKQTVSWTNLWNAYLQLYMKTGDYDNAEIYCDKLESMDVGTFAHFRIYAVRSRIYCERKQYAKALEMADKALELSIGNPPDVRSIQELKIKILCAQKGMDNVYDLFQQVSILRDSIRNTDFNAQLDELRTIYEVDQITAEKDRERIEKERNRSYFLFALGGCILLAVTLGIWMYYNHTIVQKNKALYRQIKEHDRLAEELKQITAGDAPKNLPGDRQQRQLVARFSDYLLRDRNFAKPEINLDELVSELATNRTSFFKAVKTVTEKTPSEYIRDLQLEEAKQMLETRFDLNIETIAEGCGFNSRVTFYRLFRERYHITPKEYHKIAMKSE